VYNRQNFLHDLVLEMANVKVKYEAKGKDGKGFRLNIVNAIWGQKDYEFLSGFLDLLAENYGAGLRILDFANAPEEFPPLPTA